jgi:hypothetical protein
LLLLGLHLLLLLLRHRTNIQLKLDSKHFGTRISSSAAAYTVSVLLP